MHNNQDLQEMYLHWNLLSGVGAMMMLEGLFENSELRLIDLSWNNIGKSNAFVGLLVRIIERKMSQISHWDLSYNQFTYEECVRISQSLELNHQIIGFHFEGHYGYVDHRGHLVTLK
jgi:hypothetical protein